MTADIPMLGGPCDEQTLTVEVDDYGMPPEDLVAVIVEEEVGPRQAGTYHLEAVAGRGPPWEYVYMDR